LHFNPRPRHLLLLVGILFGLASLSGVDVKPDRRKIDPAILFRSVPDAISAPQSILAQKEPRVPVLIRLASDDDALPDQVRNLGGTARKIFPRIYAAQLPTDATRYLSRRPIILYMEPDRVVWPLLDASRPAVSADIVQQGSPPFLNPSGEITPMSASSTRDCPARIPISTDGSPIPIPFPWHWIPWWIRTGTAHT